MEYASAENGRLGPLGKCKLVRMMVLQWRDEMSLGIATLDDDHKSLFSMANEVERAVRQKDSAAVGTLLLSLKAYCEGHFAREEACFAEIGHPEHAQHTALHRAFAEHVDGLRQTFGTARSDATRAKCADTLHALLQAWIAEHVLVDDVRLREGGARGAAKPKIPPSSMGAGAARITAAPPGSTVAGAAPSGKAGATASKSLVRPAAEADPAEPWGRRPRLERPSIPPHLREFLRPLHYTVPKPRTPTATYASVEKLCEAAIIFRVHKLLTFFHRRNDTLTRECTFPYVFSEKFCETFTAALHKHIFPQVWAARRMRLLDTDLDWSLLTADNFWSRLGEQRTEHALEAWALAWDRFRLLQSRNAEGDLVMRVREETRLLRIDLAPPPPEAPPPEASTSEGTTSEARAPFALAPIAPAPMAYDLPKVGNREIDAFVSLLDPVDFLLTQLERRWRLCHDLYVQAMMPRRIGPGLEEGSFRNGLLASVDALPAPWGDFLILACHRVFPRISTIYVRNLTKNMGLTEETREARLPYTMRYLRQAEERPEIHAREEAEEADWHIKMEEWQIFRKARRRSDEPN